MGFFNKVISFLSKKTLKEAIDTVGANEDKKDIKPIKEDLSTTQTPLLEAIKKAVKEKTALNYSGPITQEELEKAKKLYPELKVTFKSRTQSITYDDNEISSAIPDCNFIAIDFETANSRRDSACAIGIVFVESGLIRRKEYRLIKPPEMRFDKINMAKHKIKPEDVSDSSTFLDIWNEFGESFSNNQLVAHNASSFDMSVMRKSLEYYQIDIPDIKYYCSMEATGLLGLPSKLKDACRQLNIPLDHHNALSDAEACAKIIIEVHKNGKHNNLIVKSLNPYTQNWRSYEKPFSGSTSNKSEALQIEELRNLKTDYFKKQLEESEAILTQEGAQLELNKVRSRISKLKKKINETQDLTKQQIWGIQLEHELVLRDKLELKAKQ